MRLVDLPVDELVVVLSHLPYDDLLNVMLSHSSFYSLISNQSFWFTLLTYHYPHFEQWFPKSPSDALNTLKSFKTLRMDSQNCFTDYIGFSENDTRLTSFKNDLLVKMEYPVLKKDVVLIMDVDISQRRGSISVGIGLITSDLIDLLGGLTDPSLLNTMIYTFTPQRYLGRYHFPKEQQQIDRTQRHAPFEMGSFPHRLFNLGYFSNGYSCACSRELSLKSNWIRHIRMEVNLTKTFDHTPYTGFVKLYSQGRYQKDIVEGIFSLNDPEPYEMYPALNISQDWDMKVSARYIPLDKYDYNKLKHFC